METLIFLMSLYGLSLQDIGFICGVSKQSVHKWTKNGRIPDDAKVKKLADYFGIDAKYFNKSLSVIEQEALRQQKKRKDMLKSITFEKYEYEVKDGDESVKVTNKMPSVDDRVAMDRSNYQERTYTTLNTVIKSVQANERTNDWGYDDVSRATEVLGWLDDLADVAKVDWKNEKIVHLVLTAVKQQITGEYNPVYEDKELQLIDKVMDAIEEYTNDKKGNNKNENH